MSNVASSCSCELLLKCPECGGVLFRTDSGLAPSCAACGARADLPDGLPLRIRRDNRKNPKSVTLDDYTAAALSPGRRVCHLCCSAYVVPGSKGHLFGVCPACYQRAVNDAYAQRTRVAEELRSSDALRQQRRRARLDSVGPVAEGDVELALRRML